MLIIISRQLPLARPLILLERELASVSVILEILKKLSFLEIYPKNSGYH